ncbi:MAG: TatD family hydrolase [Candidatus Woesebacteria bacterium]|jgi:TatD DNase family protein
MQIIDTHCHYNLEPLYSGQVAHFKLNPDHALRKMTWQDHWRKAKKKGVVKSIVVGSDLNSSDKALEIASQDKNLYAAIGLHPHEASLERQIDLDQKLKKMVLNSNVIAIGETGLDYFHLQKNRTKIIKKQEDLFIKQIELANELKLSLIIHCRDREKKAYQDLLAILKAHTPEKSFILHCISGSLDYIKQALSMGAYLGVAANVTYKNANSIREIVKYSPNDRLLIETDAPYLAPEKFRAQVCEPWMIVETAKFLQIEFKIEPEQLYSNSIKAFSLV